MPSSGEPLLLVSTALDTPVIASARSVLSQVSFMFAALVSVVFALWDVY